MAVTSRPILNRDDGVKIYRGPGYGREDAVITRIDNGTGVIDAVTVKKGDVVTGLIYYLDLGDSPTPTTDYWVELPAGYVPGSQGH